MAGVFSPDIFSLVRRISQIGTLLMTACSGREVGRDHSGNRYFTERKTSPGLRRRRWVIYPGEPEASRVPPEWHIWLHHTADAPIPDSARKTWQLPHLENMTGTAQAWLPPSLSGKSRPRATGDYQSWHPEN